MREAVIQKTYSTSSGASSVFLRLCLMSSCFLAMWPFNWLPVGLSLSFWACLGVFPDASLSDFVTDGERQASAGAFLGLSAGLNVGVCPLPFTLECGGAAPVLAACFFLEFVVGAQKSESELADFWVRSFKNKPARLSLAFNVKRGMGK